MAGIGFPFNNQSKRIVMCDLLVISSAQEFGAPYALQDFAICGHRNCDGWGVGYFDENRRAVIKKSMAMAYDSSRDAIDDQLLRVAKSTRSKNMVGHLRLTSCGKTCDQNCHPYTLTFLGRDWIFAHNGTCRRIMEYKTPHQQVESATTDSARIFEYLRDRIIAYYQVSADPPTSLFGVVSAAILDLLNTYDAMEPLSDNFNLVLATGQLIFVFMHHRPFYVLQRPKSGSDALIITTCEGGLTDGEEWVRLKDTDKGYGILYSISDELIVNCEQIYRGT
jgi:predicted glutamine amidotransferase